MSRGKKSVYKSVSIICLLIVFFNKNKKQSMILGYIADDASQCIQKLYLARYVTMVLLFRVFNNVLVKQWQCKMQNTQLNKCAVSIIYFSIAYRVLLIVLSHGNVMSRLFCYCKMVKLATQPFLHTVLFCFSADQLHGLSSNKWCIEIKVQKQNCLRRLNCIFSITLYGLKLLEMHSNLMKLGNVNVCYKRIVIIWNVLGWAQESAAAVIQW